MAARSVLGTQILIAVVTLPIAIGILIQRAVTSRLGLQAFAVITALVIASR